MNTNAALIVPAHSTTNAAATLKFNDAVKPLIDIANPWFWVWCGVALLVLGGVAFFLWKLFKKRGGFSPPPPPIPPHIRAYRKLEQALALVGDPKAFSTAVSDTIRVYLEERFNFHAPDRTTEEFLYELQNTNLLTKEQKQSLGEFLSNCDLIKFAKYEPTETELRALHSSASRLVNETEPREISAAIGSSINSQPAEETIQTPAAKSAIENANTTKQTADSTK